MYNNTKCGSERRTYALGSWLITLDDATESSRNRIEWKKFQMKCDAVDETTIRNSCECTNTYTRSTSECAKQRDDNRDGKHSAGKRKNVFVSMTYTLQKRNGLMIVFVYSIRNSRQRQIPISMRLKQFSVLMNNELYSFSCERWQSFRHSNEITFAFDSLWSLHIAIASPMLAHTITNE